MDNPSIEVSQVAERYRCKGLYMGHARHAMPILIIMQIIVCFTIEADTAGCAAHYKERRSDFNAQIRRVLQENRGFLMGAETSIEKMVEM